MIRSFVPDCSRCAALCCVAFAFDRSDEFGHDKAADEQCRQLVAGYRCRIHADLISRGYGGCVRFDCLGAGQRVTQEIFEGGDWQEDATLLAPMSAAFRAMRRIHEQMRLLDLAQELGLDPEGVSERLRLVGLLDPPDGWSAAGLSAFERGPLGEEVGAFLRSLAGRVNAG